MASCVHVASESLCMCVCVCVHMCVCDCGNMCQTHIVSKSKLNDTGGGTCSACLAIGLARLTVLQQLKHKTKGT